MSRPKLTDEEKEARRKERNKRVGENYKRYDDSKGRGSADEWKAKAERIAGRITQRSPALEALGLDKLPATLTELRTARKKAMQAAHPDKGGSDEDAVRINAAFDTLAKLIDKKKK